MAVAAPGLNGCTSSENVNISMTSRADTPPTNSVSYFGSWKSYQIGVAELGYEFRCRDVPWNVSTRV
ncbi:hypothetical protein [Anabaena sp. UHCC 0204]|uniref:hypothetical protein n=1 Tax=Anabaena sp. UHCC 0204 TaxID=2590009 RepID=UPI001444CF8F|nr:hypothetical protein [Anabaena sp. UHCC 0204]